MFKHSLIALSLSLAPLAAAHAVPADVASGGQRAGPAGGGGRAR